MTYRSEFIREASVVIDSRRYPKNLANKFAPTELRAM
jgi:hypothetical protein